MDKSLLDKRINEILLEKGYIRVSELASEFNTNKITDLRGWGCGVIRRTTRTV